MIDPVQSIRIASNLAERFRALIVPAGSIVSGTLADFELRIGEAQQIYPEIWRHLDDAYGVLKERGADIAQFDELRRGELVHMGVTDIEARTEINYMALMTGRLRMQTVKTATFNSAGYARAVAACKALMAAMPDVDWAALAKAEDQEIRAAGSLQAGKYLGIIKWAAVAGVLGGVAFGAYKLFTRGGDPDENLAREHEQAKHHEEMFLREEVARRHSDLITARDLFEESCKDLDRAQYVRLLRYDSQTTEAAKVEKEPCRPKPPRCGEGRDDVQARILEKFDLVDERGDDWIWRCAGGFFKLGGGEAQPGLAVALTAKTKAGKKLTVRGVVARDGRSDLVPLATWPHEINYIEAADLDADGGAEIVTVYPQGVGIARVGVGTLTDLEPLPVLAIEATGHACTGTVEVVPDPETQKSDRLEISIDDTATGKGCPKPGFHAFVLKGDKLVDAAPPE
jgi:hypothetical protein